MSKRLYPPLSGMGRVYVCFLTSKGNIIMAYFSIYVTANQLRKANVDYRMNVDIQTRKGFDSTYRLWIFTTRPLTGASISIKSQTMKTLDDKGKEPKAKLTKLGFKFDLNINTLHIVEHILRDTSYVPYFDVPRNNLTVIRTLTAMGVSWPQQWVVVFQEMNLITIRDLYNVPNEYLESEFNIPRFLVRNFKERCRTILGEEVKEHFKLIQKNK